jgi:hypothetical protein
MPWIDNDGSALSPILAFQSEQSLGFYRSGNSNLALSYGTLVLNAASLRMAPTYSAGSTTPTVGAATYLEIANASIATITNFANAVTGQVLTLKFTDNKTLVTRANALLAGGSNFSSVANAVLVLVKGSDFWYEVSRTTTNS